MRQPSSETANSIPSQYRSELPTVIVCVFFVAEMIYLQEVELYDLLQINSCSGKFFTNSVKRLIHSCSNGGEAQGCLHLLDIFDPDKLFPASNIYTVFPLLSKEHFDDQEDYLSDLARLLATHYGISCHSHTHYGWAADIICEKANEIHCDVIVIGTHPRKTKKSFLLDSVPFKVLQQSRCPVLSVPINKKVAAFKKILFPVQPNVKVLDKYVSARLICNKNAAVLHILQLLDEGSSANSEEYVKLLHQVNHDFPEDQVILSSLTYSSKNITAKVLTSAKEINADLIVITASTQRDFWQYFSGNYAQKLMHNGDCAVLSIKPSQEGRSKRQPKTVREWEEAKASVYSWLADNGKGE